MNEVKIAYTKLTKEFSEKEYMTLLSFYNQKMQSGECATDDFATIQGIQAILVEYWDNFFNPLLNAAAKQYEKKQYDESIDSHKKLLQYNFIKTQKTPYANVNNNLGLCYRERGKLFLSQNQYKKAKTDFSQAKSCFILARNYYSVTTSKNVLLRYSQEIDELLDSVEKKIKARETPLTAELLPLSFDLEEELVNNLAGAAVQKSHSASEAKSENGSATKRKLPVEEADRATSISVKVRKLTENTDPSSQKNIITRAQVSKITTPLPVLPSQIEIPISASTASSVMVSPQLSPEMEKIQYLEHQNKLLEDKCREKEKELENINNYYENFFSQKGQSQIIKIQSFIRQYSAKSKAWDYVDKMVDEKIKVLHQGGGSRYLKNKQVAMFYERIIAAQDNEDIAEAINATKPEQSLKI